MGRTLTFLLLLCLALTCSAQFNFQDPAFLTAATAPAATGGGATDINTGLTSQWVLDENTGTSATNSVAGRSSLTPLSLHTWVSAKYNYGLSWTNTDTRTSNGGNSGLAGSNQCSISVWLKRNASGDRPSVLFNANHASISSGPSIVWWSDDKVYLDVTNGVYVTYPFSSTNTGVWYNLIGLFDLTQTFQSNRVKAYLMGTQMVGQVITGTIPGGLPTDATNTFPCRNPVGGSFYVGQVDDIRVYGGRIIDASQISQLQSAQ